MTLEYGKLACCVNLQQSLHKMSNEQRSMKLIEIYNTHFPEKKNKLIFVHENTQ
jgi:hypothetical protein